MSSERKTLPASTILARLSAGCFFAFLFVAPARAAEPERQINGVADTPSRWQWSFALRNRTGFRLHEPRVLQMSRTILDGRGIYKFGDNWRFKMELRAHYDPVHRLGYSEKPSLNPREFQLEGKVGPAQLSIGLQQVVWGQADGFRVLDVVNPLDYREFILEDFLDSRRPLWMARTDLPLAGGSLQIIWIPYFAPSPRGGDSDDFGIGLSAVRTFARTLGQDLPRDFVLIARPTQRPGYRFNSSQAGARYRRTVGRWDLTANYFFGWEGLPVPYVRSIIGLPIFLTPRVTLAPRHDRKEILGASAATAAGPVVFRLEAGWNPRKPTGVQSSESRTQFRNFGLFSGVAGLDYSPKPWLWLSGQYFLEFSAAPQRVLRLQRYSHSGSLYVRSSFRRDTLRPELFVWAGLQQRQYLIRPRLTQVLGSHWSISLGADYLGGGTLHLWGIFHSRERLVLEMKWLK